MAKRRGMKKGTNYAPSPPAGLIRSRSFGTGSVESGAGDSGDIDLLTEASSPIRPLLRGVVKIFCTFSEPSFAQPWTMRTQNKGTGSGFIVSEKRILTNAHVVAYQTSVQVRKHGDATKYTARAVAVAHECDIAILTVDDPEFWAGAIELSFAPMPRLQQEVFVVGYPIGGDTISITGGVVSRVDFDSYAHSTRESLVCSVDAAINPGNSGGPALSGGRIVGIAFQSLQGAEATGYIIPAPVVQRVLDDLNKHGHLTGFARLGFVYQTIESPYLKAYLKCPKAVTGILVNKVLPLSNLHGVLQRNDMVTAIDGKVIADDGTVALREEDRIAVGYLLTNKFIGDPIELT
jgi:S1-C subfamily serine protease